MGRKYAASVHHYRSISYRTNGRSIVCDSDRPCMIRRQPLISNCDQLLFLLFSLASQILPTMNTEKRSDSNAQTSTIKDASEVHVSNYLDPASVLVKPKWRGTSEDKDDMITLGRHQVLRVNTPGCFNKSVAP